MSLGFRLRYGLVWLRVHVCFVGVGSGCLCCLLSVCFLAYYV